MFPGAITVRQPAPAITGIVPATIQAGAGPSEITVSGRNFAADSAVLVNSASVASRYIGAGELRATVPNQTAGGTLQLQVRSPDPLNAGQYLLSNTQPLTVEVPLPPSLSVEPAPIALPPDNKPHNVTVRLSKADYRDHTLALSVSDTAKATVSPASLVIPAGQTTTQVAITPLQTGTANLDVGAAGLAGISVPLFITADFRGVNTAYSPTVGVVVESAPAQPASRSLSAASSPVGVTVGPVLTAISPAVVVAGDSPTLTVFGVDIPPGAQVSLLPATGITPGTATVDADGKALEVVMETAADAPLGARRLVVKDAGGQPLPFADPARGLVQLVAGFPAIDSIAPMAAAPGSLVRLTVRGRNLQGGVVRVLPPAGILVDTVPQISADGTSLTTTLEIGAAAPAGSRIIQVESAAGSTAATFSPANTFTVVSALGATFTPIASPLVGVAVGDPDPLPPKPSTRELQRISPAVGVLLGAAIQEVLPRAAVIGQTTTITVRGSGLGDLTAASVTPAAGITVGAPAVNAAGTEAQFSVQVDAGAALGLRRLTLAAGSQPLPFARPDDAGLLISAPSPELVSVDPQVLPSGQALATMTVRGSNLLNVSGVRVEPGAGITVAGPYAGNAEGTLLTFNIAAAAAIASGLRTVIVTTPAGDSATAPQPGNSFLVANQVGASYRGLLSPAVGVLVGDAEVRPPQELQRVLASAQVGIMIGDANPPKNDSLASTVVSEPVGLVLGAVAQAQSPDGWLQGTSGVLTVTGYGLSGVTQAAVTPATGVELGTPAVDAGGTSLTVPVAVAPDAPLGPRRLSLSTADGTQVPFGEAVAARSGIGRLPVLTSVAPIVLPQGTAVTLTVRGSDLKGVNGIAFEPADGLTASPAISWSQDGLGELLSVTVQVSSTAATGDRVVRLRVAGGMTPATATPANTVTVVPPQ